MWNYNDWLMEKLVKIAKGNGFDNIKFHIFDEQDFTKQSQLERNNIFIIVKHLTASVLFNTRTEPIQILIMSDENTLQSAMIIFKAFANQNNFTTTIDDTNYIKHQYTEPAVISNFMQVGIGYRSVLYVSATLYVMENVVDVTDVKIDNESIIPIGFSMAYNLQTDSQPFFDNYFTKSVRTSQTLGFSMTIPAKDGVFLQKMLEIVSGTSSGDANFSLSFKIKNSDIRFNYTELKLSGFTMSTAPNEIPTIIIGLVL